MATPSAARKYHRDEVDAARLQLPYQAGPGITQKVNAGQTIVIEGDLIEHYFRILSGTVRLYKAVADGRRQIIDFLGPDEGFGMIGFDQHACSVEAITDMIVITYPRERLDHVIEEKPELGQQLLRLACSELDRAQQRMLMLGRKSAEERVASFLLDLVMRRNEPNKDACFLHLAMSRQDIADHLGLTIETVSRMFTRFRRAGLIKLLDRQSMTLNDVGQLSALSEGAALSLFDPGITGSN